MLTTTVAPLAFEKMMVSCIITFVSIGLIAQAVPYLQRRYRFNNFWAWIIAILTFAVVLGLEGLFQVPNRLAPLAKQYDWMFILMGVIAMTVFWTLCFYILSGGKGSDLMRLFKRR